MRCSEKCWWIAFDGMQGDIAHTRCRAYLERNRRFEHLPMESAFGKTVEAISTGFCGNFFMCMSGRMREELCRVVCLPAENTLGRWNSQRNFDRDFAAASHCVSERERGEVSHYAPASGKHVGLLELSKRFVQGLRLLSCAKRLRCRRAPFVRFSIENMP